VDEVPGRPVLWTIGREREPLDVQVPFYRFVCWTQPLCTPLATTADLFRSKPQLVAENALLRQQLMILRRQIKRPVYGKADRLLLVLLASMVRTRQHAIQNPVTGEAKISRVNNRREYKDLRGNMRIRKEAEVAGAENGLRAALDS
jgi:hypothetical protein